MPSTIWFSELVCSVLLPPSLMHIAIFYPYTQNLLQFFHIGSPKMHVVAGGFPLWRDLPRHPLALVSFWRTDLRLSLSLPRGTMVALRSRLLRPPCREPIVLPSWTRASSFWPELRRFTSLKRLQPLSAILNEHSTKLRANQWTFWRST